MAVEVILVEDFAALGYVGDIVSVKPGYARNFLLPRGIVVEASSTNGKLLKHKMAGAQAKRAKLKTQAEEAGKVIAAHTLTFTLKAGESGKAFGAITAKDVEAQFKTLGHEIHKKQIKHFEPIRVAGDYRVEVKVHSDVTISVPLKVIAEATKKEESAVAAPKGAKRKGKKVAEETTEGTDAATDGTDA